MDKKIKNIFIENLFGFLNHDINLTDEGVTFIHGPNGCGKTTLLRLIESFFRWNVSSLFEINFENMTISYSTGESIVIQKHKKIKNYEEERLEFPILNFSIANAETNFEPFEISRDVKESEVQPSEIDHFIPFLKRVAPGEWINRENGERLSYFEVMEKFPHRLPSPHIKKRPEWLRYYQNLTKLYFIETQRLIKVGHNETHQLRLFDEQIRLFDEQNVTEVIRLYSDEIKKQISYKLAESASVTQSKDRSFPERVLSMRPDESISEEKIRNDYENTEKKIQKLMEAGLIDQEKNISLPIKKLEETEKKVLALHLKDINEKLSIFDELQQKIETFTGIISPKFRNKNFRINRKHGFVFEATQGQESMLNPAQLSSGEQHQIVLFYELIFKSGENSLSLIDEPEISLHVDWQRQFLEDILKIAKLGNHNFLIATHSPQIIGSRRDLAVPLDGGILGG
ncbi:AAA family ATPase [Desulfococcaceae bacterium HSG8]|nr:AAA family ATPase [Desulfococcaceae bacterium HSG8]